jgi:hypothetical protein
MSFILLYENWRREEEILLSKGRITITITTIHGKIERIDNPDNWKVPFFVGQPVTVFMKGWACSHGFKWNGDDPCDPGEKKVFGVKSKYIPKGHEWRTIFPNKFRD